VGRFAEKEGFKPGMKEWEGDESMEPMEEVWLTICRGD